MIAPSLRFRVQSVQSKCRVLVSSRMLVSETLPNTLAGFADGKFSLWKVDSDAERGVGGGRRCED